MKILKSWIFLICLVSGLFFSIQSTLATETTPVIIRKDDPVPPTDPVPFSFEIPIPVSATIDNDQLAIYFDECVGDVIITVYDANNNIVHQEAVNTDFTMEVRIPSFNWASGSYSVTISYGTIQLIGDFNME